MARRLLGLALASAALALPVAPASAATCTGSDAELSFQNLGQARESILCIVNAERAAYGLEALIADPLLELAAQRHTDDMVARGFFDHLNPEGIGPGARITAAGYLWSAFGENIAAGPPTPRQVMLAWMANKGYCHNVLGPGFTELGVGISVLAATLPDQVGTWTQNFGRPAGVPTLGGSTAPQAGCPYTRLEGLDPAPTASGDGQAPTGSEAPAAPARLRMRVVRNGRLVVITGTLVNSPARRVTVRVTRKRVVLLRRTVRVTSGRFRLRVLLPERTGRVVVRGTAGGLRVSRLARR